MDFLEEDPKIQFELKKIDEEDYKLFCNTDIYAIKIFEGEKFTYVLQSNKLYRCSNFFCDSIIKMIKTFKKNYITEVAVKKDKLQDFYSIIMPQIKLKKLNK